MKDTMKARLAAVLVAVAGIMGCQPAFADGGWLASKQIQATVANTTTFTLTYTNQTRARQDVASVVATCANGTGTWTLVLSNVTASNLLVKTLSTVTPLAPTFIYEGSGMLPLDARGTLTLSGSIFTNAALTNTVAVEWNLMER